MFIGDIDMAHSVEQLYEKVAVLHTKAIELHRERYKTQGSYDKAKCTFLLADVRTLAREIERGLVDLDIEFSKSSIDS
jgi:hypothetical protein